MVQERTKKQVEKDKPYIDAITCVGCSVCVEVCPADCIAISKPEFHGDINTFAFIKDESKCTRCAMCAKACPIDVITMCKPGTIPEKYTKGRKDMKKAYCRTFQAGLKIGNYFMGYRMPEYIEGAGCIQKLPAQIKAKGINNVMLVTDKGIMDLGLPNGLIKAINDEGLKLTIYSDVIPNPTDTIVEEALELFKKNGCQAIIAMGGGSSMDTAKAVAARYARPNKSIQKLQGILKVHKKIVPFWAVPTTAGTGSETTVAAVITIAKTHHKASINDPSILPRYAVLDPELTVGLPPHITSTTGMDALVHAVESYTNSTYNTKLENDLSIKAVKLIYDNLYTAYTDGKNIQARQNMQLAAFYAGRSFTRGCVGYVHAVGHTLSGLYGVPHGLAMSVILPHVMRQFGSAVHDKLADFADICGIKGKDNAEKARKFIAWIDEMNKKMNIPVGFKEIQDKDIPQIIKWASAEANPVYPVPVIWGEQDFRRLIRAIRIK